MNYGPTTYNVNPDDPTEVLQVEVTEEGVIMDVYKGTRLLGTVGMMADEWATWIVATDPMNQGMER